MKKALYPTGIVIVIGTLFLILNGGVKDLDPDHGVSARPVKTLVLDSDSSHFERYYPGKVEAAREVDLSFRVSGPLILLSANKGDSVKKGEVLARIDPRDFEIAIAQIKSGLSEARAQLSAMQTGARPEDLALLKQRGIQAEAELRKAESDMNMARILFDRGVMSKQELERHETTYAVAKAAAQMSAQDLRKGKAGARVEDLAAMEARIKGLESQLRKAKADLEDTYLKAPFSGKVADRFVENYQFVDSKESILSLHDSSTIEVIIDISEKEVVGFTRESVPAANVTFDALPDQQFELTLKEIGLKANRQLQTYPVTFTVKSAERKILPGMTATVHCLFEGLTPGASTATINRIPVGAVFADRDGSQFVWLLEDEQMTVHKRPIHTGELTEEGVIVHEGLESGDEIVTAGVQFLNEGQQVRRFTGGISK